MPAVQLLSRVFIRAASSLLGLLLGLLAATGSLATPASEVLSVSQDQLSVEVGTTTAVIISATPLNKGTVLRISADRGIDWKLGPVLTKPHGNAAWQLLVRAAPALTTDGLITLRLFRGKQMLGSSQIRISPKARPTIASSIDAKIFIDGDTLVDTGPTHGFVTLTNLTDYALELGKPALIPVPGITITLPEGPLGPILPRETRLIPLSLNVGGDSVPTIGKHVIGMTIPVSTQLSATSARLTGAVQGPAEWNGQIPLTHEIMMSVAGVGAIEGAFQLPSILLLPGLLLVVTFVAIHGLAKPPVVAQDALGRLSIIFSPWVWIATVSLSGVMIGAYRLIFGRWITYAYGMVDVLRLWLASIFLGALVGAVAYLYEKRCQKKAAAPRFPAGMAPLDLLAQLAAEDRPVTLPAVLIGQNKLLFDLRKGEAGEAVWACSRILYIARSPFDTTKIGLDLGKATTAETLDLLKVAKSRGEIDIGWDRIDSNGLTIEGPQLVAPETFTAAKHHQIRSLIEEGI